MGYKFIELPNFVKTEAELVTDRDKWIYLLKNLSSMDKIPAVLNKRMFQRVFKIAELNPLTEEEKAMYNSSLKAKIDYENTISFAEEKAFGKGEEKGRHEEALEIAREMKRDNFSMDKIAKLTKLSIQEIKVL